MYRYSFKTKNKVFLDNFSKKLCGRFRKGHFEGVLNVVNRLLEIIKPKYMFLGIKDYQQLAVIRRMVEDLCMPIQVTSAPIHRETDGLAMSSRNRYINDDERPKVIILKDTLDWIASQIKGGNRNFSELEHIAAQQIEQVGFKVDYITCSNSKTLDLAANDDSDITILGAIFTESARLIDNVSVSGN